MIVCVWMDLMSTFMKFAVFVTQNKKNSYVKYKLWKVFSYTGAIVRISFYRFALPRNRNMCLITMCAEN